jgi:GTP cyclohydrolase I
MKSSASLTARIYSWWGGGKHLCMSMRGIKTDALMSNSVVRGRFRDLPALRAEAFDLTGKR